MRNIVSIFSLVALVVATTITPAVANSMVNTDKKMEQASAVASNDCHGGSHASNTADADLSATQDKSDSGGCCDKGICKCIGGTCYSSLSQILNNTVGPNLAAKPTQSLVFVFDNQFVDSALAKRLKRPPKA